MSFTIGAWTYVTVQMHDLPNINYYVKITLRKLQDSHEAYMDIISKILWFFFYCNDRFVSEILNTFMNTLFNFNGNIALDKFVIYIIFNACNIVT